MEFYFDGGTNLALTDRLKNAFIKLDPEDKIGRLEKCFQDIKLIMVSFEKIINDHNFSFQENTTFAQVYFNIKVDIYSFIMMPLEDGWQIVGDVPP